MMNLENITIEKCSIYPLKISRESDDNIDFTEDIWLSMICRDKKIPSKNQKDCG